MTPTIRKTIGLHRRPALAIAGLVGLMLVVINAGALYIAVTQRSQAVEQARLEAVNIATLLSKQTDRLLQSVDVVATGILDKMRGMGVVTSDDLKWAGSQRLLYDHISRAAVALDFVNWFTIIDTRGRIVSTSRRWPAPDFDFSQRDYFRALSTSPSLDTFVSEPIADRDTGKLTIYFARKIRDPRGGFIGIVIGGVPESYFTELFDTIRLHDGGSIALLREDGVVLAHMGDQQGGLGLGVLHPTGAPDAIRHDGGAVSFSADAVAQSRLTVVDSLDRYPLRIAVGVPLDSVYALWRKEAWTIGFLVLVVNLSILFAATLGIRRFREIDAFRRIEHHAARHDILTGLPNRGFFQERLAEMKAGPEDGQGFGLILLDLDNFKEVNDTQGHHTGDQLLRLVSERLSKKIGERAFLARLGGDEFAILMSDVADENEIVEFGRRLLDEFLWPFEMQQYVVSVGATLGAAFGHPGDADGALFDRADMALYQAKEAGRNTIRFFSNELNEARQDRKALIHDLQQAIGRGGEISLHYQPIIDLATCRLSAFEALVRWSHPVRGPVPPSVFIPVAEETGLIRQLGLFVLQEACLQALNWPRSVKVAVNLSSVQVQTGNIVEDVKRVLVATGLPSDRLEIEITESMLLDVPRAQPILHQFRELGISVSLDDFGTGYSSLSYLRSFPFQRLKIDRSFVMELSTSAEALSIVRTIKDLGDQLGMAVTAEGIETHEQLRQLQGLGPMSGQGYLFSRPVPAAETEMLIAGYGVADETPSRSGKAPRLSIVPKA